MKTKTELVNFTWKGNVYVKPSGSEEGSNCILQNLPEAACVIRLAPSLSGGPWSSQNDPLGLRPNTVVQRNLGGSTVCGNLIHEQFEYACTPVISAQAHTCTHVHTPSRHISLRYLAV